MVLLQALLSLLGRSLGKIFRATFGWAVTALFGERPKRETTLLSIAVAGAAAWPLLVLGIPFPRVAAALLAFVPISQKVPSEWVRFLWVALAAFVPIALGALLGRFSNAKAPEETAWKRLLRGFPTTLAIAAAFAVLLVVIPIRKLVAALRRRVDLHLPLVMTADAYADTARRVQDTVVRSELNARLASPPWWLSAPSTILRALGGGAFRHEIPARLFYMAGPEISLLLNPNGLTLHGLDAVTTRVRGLMAESLAFSDALQTMDPGAQKLERRLNDLRGAFETDAEAHAGSHHFRARLEAEAADLLASELPLEDWETLYRQMLQLSRAFAGARPLLRTSDDSEAGRETRRASGGELTSMEHQRQNGLTTGELLGEMAGQVKLLAQKEVDLAKLELKAQVAAELKTARGLLLGGAAALVGVTMLLVSAAFALALRMPGWAAALGLGVLALGAAGAVGLKAWTGRVRKPLAVTRQTLEDDVRWARNRIA